MVVQGVHQPQICVAVNAEIMFIGFDRMPSPIAIPSKTGYPSSERTWGFGREDGVLLTPRKVSVQSLT